MTYYLDMVANIGIFMILAMSLNVICGLTGLLQLGHAGFYAIGAYAAALVCMYADSLILPGGMTLASMGHAGFLVTALAGMLAAAVFALAIGIPCLRLRGDYLAIATLAFGEIVMQVLRNVTFPGPNESFGGPQGFLIPMGYRHRGWWLVVVLAVGLTYLLLLNLKRSAIGRAMLAIREDEIAARAMGVNVPLYKTMSFVVCAVFAGLAGALYTHKQGHVSPKLSDLMTTIQVLLMVVLGGLGSFTGALMAAVIIVCLPQILSELPTIAFTLAGKDIVIALGTQKQLFFAILLILLVRFVPNGLFGLNEGGDLWRRWRSPRQPDEAANAT